MHKVYLVAVENDATTAQADAFTEWLRDPGQKLGFWHHMGRVWLVADNLDAVTVISLREKVLELMPGVHNVVVDVTDSRWAAVVPNVSHDWLYKNLGPHASS